MKKVVLFIISVSFFAFDVFGQFGCPVSPNPIEINIPIPSYCPISPPSIDCDGDPDDCEISLLAMANNPSFHLTVTYVGNNTYRLKCKNCYRNCDGDWITNGCETEVCFNENHCGACGNACPDLPNTDDDCFLGICYADCEPLWTDCNGIPGFPGPDGCECPVLPNVISCQNNQCDPKCEDGYFDCDNNIDEPGGNGCETKEDENNCGDCGYSCFDHAPPNAKPASPGCVDGKCKFVCQSGYVDCNGDLNENSSDGCECEVVPNASLECENGQCVYTCADGFDDCDNNMGNGCETHIAEDVNNCGECDRVCTPPNNAILNNPGCVNGSCKFVCKPWYIDCDNDLNEDVSNGCECKIKPNANLNCDIGCPEGYSCVEDYRDCNGDLYSSGGDGCETNIKNDEFNCGDCDIICDDNDPCTEDKCINGICENIPICDDGDPCTIDHCNNGDCYYTDKCPPHLTCCGNGSCQPDEAECRGVQGNSCGQSLMAGEFGGKIFLNGEYTFSRGEKDIIIARYGEDNIPIWKKFAGGIGDDRGNAITVDGMDNAIAIGYFSETTYFDSNVLNSQGDKDVFLVKYDVSGQLLWLKSFGSSGEDIGYGVTVDKEDNIIITGHFHNDFEVDGVILSSSGNDDIFLIKFSSHGDLIWAESLGGAYHDSAFGVKSDSNGDLIVTGHFEGTVFFGNTAFTSSGIADIFIAKFSSNGEIKWAKRGWGSNGDFSKAIAIDNSNNIFITGDFYGSLTFDGDQVLQSSGSADFFAAKFASNGDFQWVRHGTSNLSAEGKSVTIDTTGNVVVTGLYQGTFNLESPGHIFPNLGLRDIFLVKYSNYNGEILWSKSEGGTDNDFSLAISNDTEGNTKYAGCFFGTSTINGVTSTALGSSDLFVTGIVDGETGNNGALFFGEIIAISQTSCIGDSDGQASIEVFGGSPPYTIEWSNGDSSKTAYNLSSGTYEVAVYDANNFSFSIEVEIEEPEPLEVETISISNVGCFGESSGSITVNALGGTPPYYYQWDNGSVEPIVGSLLAGDYLVTVTDNNGCTNFLDITLSESPMLTADLTTIDESLFRGDNGSASISPLGGTPPYTYQWDNGAISSDINNLAPGNYGFVITDFNGCIFESFATINPVTCNFDVEAESNDISCFGANDGQAFANINEGEPPFTFIWSTGSSSSNLENLSSGIYSVTAIDGKNCPFVGTVEIIEPLLLSAHTVSVQNVNCSGNEDGTITIEVQGGVSPYTYLWSSGGTSPTEGNLTEGVYSVTITDNNSCTTILSNEIIVDDEELPVVQIQDLVVYLDNAGMVSITPDKVDNGSNDNCGIASTILDATNFSCSNVGTNIVTITVTDVNGNQNEATANISVLDTIPPQINCIDNIIVTDCNFFVEYDLPEIFDNCGTASLIIESGIGSGNEFPFGETIETYSVSDNSGNTNTCSFSVTILGEFSISVNMTQPTCTNFSDGSATIDVTGGTPGYSYSWSNGQSGAQATGLEAGVYFVTITDNEGCTEIIEVVLNAPPLLVVNVDEITNATFGLDDGSIEISVNGGVPPYAFTWLQDGNIFSQEEDIFNLGPGSYVCQVEDSLGCIIVVDSIEVENIVSVGEHVSAEKLIKLFPNPSDGTVTLFTHQNLAVPSQFSLYDITGKQLMMVENLSRKIEFDLSKFPKGVYICKVVVGNKIIGKKLMLQ